VASNQRTKLETRTLNSALGRTVELAVPIRGRWLRSDHVGLRNAAWAVRNARWAGQDEAMMIAWVCREVQTLLDGGERLESVVPSLVDLFLRP
jgi:hypothetical protein